MGKAAAKQESSAYRLVGTYVDSPLCWAISVGAKSELKDASELKSKRVGVSRIGRYERCIMLSNSCSY